MPVLEAMRWINGATPGSFSGRRYPVVQQYNLYIDAEQMTSAFQCVFPDIGEAATMRSGDVVWFRIGDQQLMVGRVDKSIQKIAPGRRERIVIGRDLGYYLTDNDMPFSHSEDPVGIVNIARRAADGGHFTNIVTRFASDVTSRVHAEPGETRADFLRRYLRLTDNIAFVDAFGQLIIGGLATGPAVGAVRVFRDTTNIEQCRVIRGDALAFSKVEVLTSENGDQEKIAPEEKYVAEITVGSKYLERHRILRAPETVELSDAKTLAERELQLSARNRLMVEITIPDHEVDTVVPMIDQHWNVYVEGEQPVDETLYLKTIRYSRDQADQVSTSMLFVRPRTVVSRFALQPEDFTIAPLPEGFTN